MTMYHRGKKRSLYRKHAFAVGMTLQASAGAPVQKTIIRSAPSSGTILIKSIRGLVILPAVASTHYAAGWVGFARYASVNPTPTIEESEVFGVQNWVVGATRDTEFLLDLKGITLTKDESFYLVGQVTFASGTNFAIKLASTFLYAMHEVPA